METQKMNKQESQERKFEVKVRRKSEQFHNIYIVAFAFLF